VLWPARWPRPLRSEEDRLVKMEWGSDKAGTGGAVLSHREFGGFSISFPPSISFPRGCSKRRTGSPPLEPWKCKINSNSKDPPPPRALETHGVRRSADVPGSRWKGTPQPFPLAQRNLLPTRPHPKKDRPVLINSLHIGIDLELVFRLIQTPTADLWAARAFPCSSPWR